MGKFKTMLQQAVVGWLAVHTGTSQRGLAEAAGIDPGDMSKIARGEKASLNMESAGRLAGAMKVTIEDLLAGRSEGSGADLRVLPLDLIDPSPTNPRKAFDADELAGLAASIRESGLLQPLVVMNSLTKGRFELIAGHRRLAALALNNVETAPCLVRAGETSATARALQIIENLQRVDIPPLEEARAFAALQDENKTRWTTAEIGRLIGKSDRFVAQRIAIARNLAPALQDKLAAGELKVDVARTLATAPAKLQKLMAKDPYALLSVDNLRRKLQDKAIPVSTAAFKTELYDGEFLEENGKRWFADAAKFGTLQRAAGEARAERLRKEWPAAAFVAIGELNKYVWADDGRGVNGWWDDKAEAEKRRKGLTATDCTALVYLDRNKLKSAKNVVLREVWDAKADKLKRDDADGGAQIADGSGGHGETAAHREAEQQRQAVNARIAEGIAGRPDIAKRLVLYAFLGQINGIEIAGIDVRPLAAPWAEQLADYLPAADEEDGYFEAYNPVAAAEDALWTLLAAQDEATIDAMLARFMSGSTHIRASWNGSRADGLTRGIAAMLDVEIPAAFIPAPPEADEAADDTAAEAA